MKVQYEYAVLPTTHLDSNSIVVRRIRTLYALEQAIQMLNIMDVREIDSVTELINSIAATISELKDLGISVTIIGD